MAIVAPLDPRLLQAISTPSIQTHVSTLVGLALRALDDMRALDESLYERFVSTRNAPVDPTGTANSMRKLWEETFRGLNALLAQCHKLVATRKPARAQSEPADIDFGEMDAGPAPDDDDLKLDFEASDIGNLVDIFDEGGAKGDSERWAQIVEKISAIEYGLSSQLEDAKERLEVALGSRQFNQVLGLLDDTQGSASEGVHALVSAIYDEFAPGTDPASTVPGYLTSLSRALMVRRGVAELAANLGPLNDELQGDKVARHAAALASVKETVRTFVRSAVCRAMRAADRFQMVEFDRDLHEDPASVARSTSEGLVKYLESLASINLREVLVVHDQHVLEQMRDALSNARQLVDISPRTANEMLNRAYMAALRLRGKNASLDQMIIRLDRYAPTSSAPSESGVFLERLEELLASAGG